MTDLKKNNFKTIARIIKEIILPHWFLVFFTTALMFLIAANNGFQALLIQPIIDQTLFAQDASKLMYQIPILIVIVSIAKGICTYYQMVLSNYLTNKMQNELRLKLFKSFLVSDMETFNNSSSSKMLSNILNDIGTMMNAINILMSGVFKNFFSAIFLIGVMFYMNYKLALISLVGMPLAIAPVIIVYRLLNKYMHRNQTQLEDTLVLIDDSLRGAKVVKSYNAEDFEIGRMNASLEKLNKTNWRIARTSNIPGPLNETLIGVGTAAVFLYGGSLVVGGDTTPGSFFAFFTAMMMAYKPLKTMSGLNVRLQMCLVCANRVFDLLDRKPLIVDKADAKDLDNLKGDIKFENVSFAYNENKKALENIDLHLESGKSYAFVGKSGGGKTTIINLLLRFYDANSGKILIDGHDIKDISLKSLRNSIAYVGQDVQLFDDTILNNIRYNNLNATEDDVIKAAKLAEAHQFITECEGDYNMRVGQNGSRLSGGQKQRISIARAIIKNSPILILDEATSALDSVSEALIQKAFDHLKQGKTTLTIAHRLSTIVNADKIFVIKDAHIIEYGTHQDLLSKNGEYAKLYANQFQD